MHNNSLLEDLETETCFRFHQSLVNSGKNDPAKLGRANLPGAGIFARGQKQQIPYCFL
jgi:hypothetical protein